MLRRPPRSTLFPYHDALPIYTVTTLAGLATDKTGKTLIFAFMADKIPSAASSMAFAAVLSIPADGILRSEEHTSELQSHSDLVCRLLLEKKKKYKKYEDIFHI